MEQSQDREVGPALGMKYREGVRAHARAHYCQGGWDFIVEAFDNGQLAEVIGSAESLEEAIGMAEVRAHELDRARRERAAS
jgi:hypothetical protein